MSLLQGKLLRKSTAYRKKSKTRSARLTGVGDCHTRSRNHRADFRKAISSWQVATIYSFDQIFLDD